MTSRPLTPKEINNLMGRGRDEVRRRTRKGRAMRTNPAMVPVRVEKSPRKRLSFHASYEMEIILLTSTLRYKMLSAC